MSLPGITETLFPVLAILLNMAKLWEYFDCCKKNVGLFACPGPRPFSPLVRPELAMRSHQETLRGRGEAAMCAADWAPPHLESLQ